MVRGAGLGGLVPVKTDHEDFVVAKESDIMGVVE
jgi:co-chaperonin GroES (HSP10)